MLNIQTPFLNSEREIQLKVTIGSETLLSEDIISFSITATMGDSYTIGNFTSRELDLEILTDSAPAAVKGQMIIPYVICGNQELKLGVFYADANGIEVNRKTMSIKAYDVLSKLGAGALSLSVAYEQVPLITAVNLLLGIMGTTLSIRAQAMLNNTSFRIDIPIGGNTIQRTMRAVSACLGSTAVINVNGQLDFIKPNSLSRIDLTADEYISFKTLSDDIFTIGGITLTIKSEDSSQPDTVYSYGDTTHNLINLDWDESNVLKNQADIATVALEIGIPFSYYGYQLNTIGLPFIELGDYIRLTDFDNNTYNLPVLSYTHTFNKGITSTFGAKIPSSGTIAAGASGGGGSITQAINNLNITTIQTKTLVAETIEANEARFNELDADKADIDLLNVDVTTITEAWIKDLMVQGGMIAQDGQFYKLVGAKVYGDVIEANTVKADSLILQGANGLYYAINVDALGQTTASSDIKYQEGIDGKIIVAHSITADEITANNIQGTGG